MLISRRERIRDRRTHQMAATSTTYCTEGPGTSRCLCGRLSSKSKRKKRIRQNDGGASHVGGPCQACAKELDRFGARKVDFLCRRSERNPKGSFYVARLVKEIDRREAPVTRNGVRTGGAPDRLRGRTPSSGTAYHLRALARGKARRRKRRT